MLYQMMLHTKEDFRAAQLQVSPKAPDYFNVYCTHSLCGVLVDAHLPFPLGQLKKNPEVLNWPIKARIDELNVVSDEEAAATVSLIERCLHLDPAHRPTAAELLSDSWFNGVE